MKYDMMSASSGVIMELTTAEGRKFRIRLRSRQDPVRALDKLLGINKIESTRVQSLRAVCPEDASVMGCRLAQVTSKVLSFLREV